MRIVIDEAPLESSADNAGSALVQIANTVERQGRIVVEVWMDGERLDEAGLAAIETNPVVPREIKVSTTTVRDLLADVFRNALEAMQEIESGQREAATMLQAGRRPEAMDELMVTIERWTQVGAAVDRGMRLAGWSEDSPELAAANLAETVDGLAASLREIRESMRSGDDVRLADCLLYEMPQTVERWNLLLPALGRCADSIGKD